MSRHAVQPPLKVESLPYLIACHLDSIQTFSDEGGRRQCRSRRTFMRCWPRVGVVHPLALGIASDVPKGERQALGCQSPIKVSLTLRLLSCQRQLDMVQKVAVGRAGLLVLLEAASQVAFISMACLVGLYSIIVCDDLL